MEGGSSGNTIVPFDHSSSELYQRTDDLKETISKRMEVYNEQTKPLIDFYNLQNKTLKINAKGSIKEVNKKIIQTLD